MKRLALMVLLIGGMFAAAVGQTQASPGHGTGQKHATKHKAAKHKSTRVTGSSVNPLAGTVTTNGATITVHKAFCLNVGSQNTCNGQPDTAFPSTLQFQVCAVVGGNTDCSQSTILCTFDVSIGSNAKGVDSCPQQFEFGQPGDTYLVCEAPTAGFTAFPRPDQSTGGSFQSASEFCIQVTPTSGNVQAQFLNVEHAATPTPTATATNTPVPPTATPTNTPVPPTATPTNTPVPPTATPTNTPVPPTATPTNTPVPPTATPTNTPVPPTATPTSTPVPQTTPAINKCVTDNQTATSCGGVFGNTLTVASGEQVIYIVSVSNGPTATANLTATDTLQPGQTFLGCVPTPGCTYSLLTNTVTFNTGPLTAGATVSFYIAVQVGTGPLSITNQAFIGGTPSQITVVMVRAVTTPPVGVPVVPVVIVNTAVPTNTPIPPTPTSTPIPPTSTSTPVPPTNTPVPPTATVAPTDTPVPPTATVAPTDTPVPPVPTNTPKAATKPTATPAPTATTPAVPVAAAPTPPPPTTKLPVTGFGGSELVAHNLAVGREFRSAHGQVALGNTTGPQSGGSSPMTPILPVILGALVVGLGALTRRFAFAKR